MKTWFLVPAVVAGLLFSSVAPASSVETSKVHESNTRKEIDSIPCDASFDDQLRVGENHIFDVTLVPEGEAFAVSNIHFWFYEDEDYNNGNGIVYTATKEAKDANGLISKKMTVINMRRKTHTLACGMKAAFLLLDINVE